MIQRCCLSVKNAPVLHIFLVTEDMVKNGRVVIERAQYNSIIIPRTLDADVRLDTVKADEIVIEGGADYTVTLYYCDIAKVDIGVESTILDMTVKPPMILRPGFITPEMIDEVVSGVSIDPAILGGPMAEGMKPKAPGMKYRHYAPAGDMWLVEGDNDRVVARINELAGEKQKEGYRVAVIGTEENISRYQADVVKSIGSREEPESIAVNLYGTLREMDELGVQIIYGESFEEGDFYGAIRNRILKAAGYQVIKV